MTLSARERSHARRLADGSDDPRIRERAAFALEAANGLYTLEELAAKVQRRRSTVQNWLRKFEVGGLDSLLARGAAPGRVSDVAQARVQRFLQAGLKSRRWSSAAQVAAGLQETFGITRSRKSIYYWLKKHGVPSPGVKPSSRRRVTP